LGRVVDGYAGRFNDLGRYYSRPFDRRVSSPRWVRAMRQ